MTKRILFKILLSLLLSIISAIAIAEPKITVFAAASLTNVMSDLAKQYETEKLIKVQTSFAASSALAKQIENGAPADIFMAADSKWMNYLQEKNAIDASTRSNVLGNHLVLIAPKGKKFNVQMDKNFKFADAFYGKLCTGDVESVPVGIYAKQALISFNWWDSIKSRIVGTQDVRAALVFVERRECDAGVVYETDAKVSNLVEVVASFPDESHEPIVYPLALVKGAKPEAKDFYDYLKSDKAKAIFKQYGFNVLIS